MSENNVKETAESLLIQIIEYLNKAEPNDEEREHRFKELACSLVTLCVEFGSDKDRVDILNQINEICHDIRDISMAGALRFLDGDMTNLKMIWRD